MAIEVIVTSENKGSNPGGRCIVRTPKKTYDKSYFKYCNRGNVPKGFVLNSQHQPIYEAMFVEMSKMLGLNVPDYFVILNPKGDHVSLDYQPEKGENIRELRPNNASYFVSKLVNHVIDENSPGIRSILNEEKIYRDLLNIGNVSDRPDNYTLINVPGREPFVLYIDLGCGLVDAHGGLMTLRPGLDRKYKNLGFGKNLRDLKKRLGGMDLKTGGEAMLNLLKFGEYIPRCCSINVLDASKNIGVRSVPVTKLLSEGELRDLSGLYFAANSEFLRRYKGDLRLFRSS